MKHVLLILRSLWITGCTNKRSSNTTSTAESAYISDGLTDSLTQQSEKKDSVADHIDSASASQPLTGVLEPREQE